MIYTIFHQYLSDDDKVIFNPIGTIECSHPDPEVESQRALQSAKEMFPGDTRLAVSVNAN